MSIYQKDEYGNVKKIGGYLTQRFNARWFLCTRTFEDGVEYYTTPDDVINYFKPFAEYTVYTFGFNDANTTTTPKLRYNNIVLDICDFTSENGELSVGQLNGVFQMFTEAVDTDNRMNFCGNTHPDQGIVSVDSISVPSSEPASVENTGTPGAADLLFKIPVGQVGLRGVQGEQGVQGIQGNKGDIGPIGPNGTKGDKGDQGNAGPQGPQGSQGLQGTPGPTGDQGPQGLQGPQGQIGLTGATGENGTSLNIGSLLYNSPTELPSFASVSINDAFVVKSGVSYELYFKAQGGLDWTIIDDWGGIQGPKGDKGDKGDQGLQGPQGLKGEQGIQGMNGPAGIQGPIGASGAKGDTGATGSQGIKGDIGEIGPQGAIGLQGVQGPVGAKGDQGSQGVQGIQGPIGKRGPSVYQTIETLPSTPGTTFVLDLSKLTPNVTFTDMTIGSTIVDQAGIVSTVESFTAITCLVNVEYSLRGLQGIKGDTGDIGPTGAIGPTGPQGSQGIKGDTGATGATGAQGIQGAQGVQGPVGPKGDTSSNFNSGSLATRTLTGYAQYGDAGAVEWGPNGPHGMYVLINNKDSDVLSSSYGNCVISNFQTTVTKAEPINITLDVAASDTGPDGATMSVGLYRGLQDREPAYFISNDYVPGDGSSVDLVGTITPEVGTYYVGYRIALNSLGNKIYTGWSGNIHMWRD